MKPMQSKGGVIEEHQRDFLRGYAAAIGALVRLHNKPSLALDIVRNDGLKLSDFKTAGVEDFDLRQLRRAFKS